MGFPPPPIPGLAGSPLIDLVVISDRTPNFRDHGATLRLKGLIGDSILGGRGRGAQDTFSH